MKHKTPYHEPELSDSLKEFLQKSDQRLISEFLRIWLNTDIPDYDGDYKTFSQVIDDTLNKFLMEKIL